MTMQAFWHQLLSGLAADIKKDDAVRRSYLGY